MNRRELLQGVIAAFTAVALPFPVEKSEGLWHHYCYAVRGGAIEFFIDGIRCEPPDKPLVVWDGRDFSATFWKKGALISDLQVSVFD